MRNRALFAFAMILLWMLFGLTISLLAAGCTEEIGPCYEHEQQCKSLLAKMNQATTEAEKEQYRQFYLAEKHLLDYCNSQ